MATTIDAAEWMGHLRAAEGFALTQTMQEFQQAAQSAYAGTRFPPALQLRPAPMLTEAELFSSNPLLRVVEYPTKPHLIVARNHPNLVFWWVRESKWFVGPLVHHPGTAGKGYIAPLYQQAGALVGLRLAQALEALNA